MVVEFWSLNKRVNSTKQPDGSGQSLNVMLKQAESSGSFGFSDSSFDTAADNSQLSPTFALNWDTGKFPFNYCHCWGCYYFIDDVQYGINNLVFVRCRIDVLATYKSAIQATTAKVLYSSSNYSLDIDDKRNALKENVVTRSTSAHINLGTLDWSKPTVIMTCINSRHGLAVYAMTPGNFQALLHELMVNSSMQENLSEYFLAPIDAVTSVQYAPYNLVPNWYDGSSENPYWGNPETAIPLGNVETVADGNLIAPDLLYEMTTRIEIPHIYGDYRDGQRCSSYSLYIPYAGSFNLDPETLYKEQYLYLHGAVAMATGEFQGCVEVSSQQSGLKRLTPFSGQAYTDIPIGQIIKPSAGILTQAIPALSSSLGGISGNVIGAMTGSVSPAAAVGMSIIPAISGIYNTVAGGLEAATSHSGVKGALQGAVGHYTSGESGMVTLTQYANVACDAPTAIVNTLGLPLNQTVSLGSLTGFCQTTGASVSVAATDAEILAINQFLDSGIFIE